MDEEIKWTNLTLVDISKAFKAKGMNISEHVVKQLLERHGFVCQCQFHLLLGLLITTMKDI